MNHNSFPSGEQTPDQQSNDNSTEFPSFEEHMKQLEQEQENGLTREEQIEHNSRVFNAPTLKNTELPENVAWMDKGIESVAKKVKQGEPLTNEDIMRDLLHINPAGSEEVFNQIGLANGADFDVRLSDILYGQNGEIIQQPLSISFRNPDQTTTLIRAYKNEDSSIDLSAVSGPQELGLAVDHRGGKAAETNNNTTRLAYVTIGRDGQIKSNN